MCINRECKEFTTRPSPEYLNRTALFLPVRVTAIRNLEGQIFAERKELGMKHISTIHATDGESKKFDSNVRCQVEKLTEFFKVLACASKKLTPQQVHDLMNFKEIGPGEYDRRVEYYILRTPSNNPPKHRKNLLTFTEKKARKKKGSEIERERKLQIECWKKRVAFATSSGQQVSTAFEQCLELPRAIAQPDGTPANGAKSNTTKAFQKRYEQATPPIISTMVVS